MANDKLKQNYKKTIELCLLVVLSVFLFTFVALRFYNISFAETTFDNPEPIVLEYVQPTKQEEPAKRLDLPTVPVESDNPELPENVTIQPNLPIDLGKIPPMPNLDNPDENHFISVEEWPKPIGGYSAILRHLKYPEMVRKLFIQGQSVINVLVDESGNVLDTKVFKSAGHPELDEAAIKAIRQVKWKPAKQRELPVKVWVKIPVTFKLNN